MEETGKKQDETGKKQEETEKVEVKTPKTGRNWMILNETGRNRKKQ